MKSKTLIQILLGIVIIGLAVILWLCRRVESHVIRPVNYLVNAGTLKGAVNNIEKTPKMKEHRLSITQKTTTHMETVASISDTLYEDTLGNGIWQSRKNIVLAEEMLKDCEMTIRKSGQAIRNEVMEASFHALPQKPNFRLVIDEEGDYVITDDTQPSPVRL